VSYAILNIAGVFSFLLLIVSFVADMVDAA
jgi:hypothetical protein